MSTSDRGAMRVAFQGEPGAFSEAAAIQLLGDAITTVPRATFDAAFRAIDERAADALLAPVENTLAGSVVRAYDLLLQSRLTIVAETILPIEHHLIACPGAMRAFFLLPSTIEAGAGGRHRRQRPRSALARR